MWRVPFELGTLKAVSRSQGEVVLTREVRTAGRPARIILSADRDLIKADGADLSFVTVKIVDADGTIVPYADSLVNFQLTGEGSIAGMDNGSQISHEPFKANYRKAFHGLALVIIQAKKKSGTITVKATSAGLAPGSVVIDAQ